MRPFTSKCSLDLEHDRQEVSSLERRMSDRCRIEETWLCANTYRIGFVES